MPIGATPLVNTSTAEKFQSKGETKRESTVTASIGCRIVNVLPGGVMQVEGARQTRVNNENQIIVVKGLVRPIDVGPSNTVASTQLADCQIEYYGEGVLAEAVPQHHRGGEYHGDGVCFILPRYVRCAAVYGLVEPARAFAET